MKWPWSTATETAPQRATAPAPAPASEARAFIDYGPAVHALEVLEQRNAADIRALKTEWLDHAARMETLVRKLLKLSPSTAAATPANGEDHAPVPAVTRADLLRAHRAKGGRT